jgi:hypothetical protein
MAISLTLCIYLSLLPKRRSSIPVVDTQLADMCFCEDKDALATKNPNDNKMLCARTFNI